MDDRLLLLLWSCLLLLNCEMVKCVWWFHPSGSFLCICVCVCVSLLVCKSRSACVSRRRQGHYVNVTMRVAYLTAWSARSAMSHSLCHRSSRCTTRKKHLMSHSLTNGTLGMLCFIFLLTPDTHTHTPSERQDIQTAPHLTPRGTRKGASLLSFSFHSFIKITIHFSSFLSLSL